MSDSADHIRDLAPELALGIADETDRAHAMEHVAGCADCARLLAELSEVADQLLLLAPQRETPAGFQEGLVARLRDEARPAGELPVGPRPEPRPRWRRAVALAAAAVLGGAVAVGAVYLGTADERGLVAEYRRALQQADGSYFGGLPLRDRGGERVGTMFGYEGTPPWIFLILRSPDPAERYRVEAITVKGDRIRLGSVEMMHGRATFGAALPVKLFDIARVRLVDDGGAARFVAVAPQPAG